ncbi:DNA/RNA non-specific endonuclease [Roseburia inulinivorans]|nr:DNA/RNA non-specific endonuclease [Roseburia inulinivorans]
MAGIKIDPEMLDIYMELLNKLMAGSETDGGNARLEVSGAGKTEDGLVRYNEEVNKLGDDLRELYGNMGEILGRIRDGTLFKNADKVSVVARSTDGAGVLAKHADEAAAWLHGGKVFRYSDETAEAVASGEKLLKESGTIYESFADMMSPEDAKRYLDFLENGSREGLTSAELAGVEKADALLVSQKVGYEDAWDLRNAGDALESGSKGGTSTVQKVLTDNPFDEAGNLKPNIKYQTGEFKYNYETDANGRISNWNTDNLQLTERDGRLNYNSDSLGKIEGDHAGHLAGDRFGGSPERDNIVSQSQNVNLSQYKKIENQWAKAISEGKEVTVNIDIKYDGDGFRPIEFNVEYTIDGDFFSQSILN